MDHFIGLDDDAPPAKRLKLGLGNADNRDPNNNIENKGHEIGLPSPKSDVRKRKIAVKRQVKRTILELSPDVLLEVFEHLPLNDLCNVAQSGHSQLADLTRKIFRKRYRNGFRMHANGKDDIELMVRVLSIFGNVITSAGFSTNYRH